jgi:hypothetical protein
MSLLSSHKKIALMSHREREAELNKQVRIVLFCLVRKYGPVKLDNTELDVSEGELKTRETDFGVEWYVEEGKAVNE